MPATLVGAALAAAFGTFILYATSHPTTRASGALFWWSIRFGNGPENSAVTRFFGYLTGVFWIAIAIVGFATTVR